MQMLQQQIVEANQQINLLKAENLALRNAVKEHDGVLYIIMEKLLEKGIFTMSDIIKEIQAEDGIDHSEDQADDRADEEILMALKEASKKVLH